MNSELRTVLIFEPQSGGHRAGFIRWLRKGAATHPGCRLLFFTADDVDSRTARRLAAAGRWRKPWILYRLFRQACRKYKPDHALILELTHVELPLALLGSPVPFSAILFVQYPERFKNWKLLSTDDSGFSRYWKYLWVQAQPASKHWKTSLLLHRAPVKNLFLLNGEKSCRFLHRHFGSRARFIPIPDPAPEASAEPNFSLREHFNIPPERKIFLFFGAISKRKGADILLEALQRLRPDIARQSEFIFCGEPEASYKENFQHLVAEVQDLGGVELHVESTFVSDERMMALFEQCDVVLMPYTRPEYSSGILALAAKAGKPVLGPQGGLLGRLITENGLGATTAITPAALAEALVCPITVDETKQRAFSARSCSENFSRKILDAICNES